MSDATERAPSLVADRYRLDERIGSGPMGEVWRGYDTRADWVVAVKVLGARAAGAATREVLRQHAQAVARVIHPNVAMVLDVGEHEGAPFLVMEYLTGLSLREELAARGPMKIVEVCDLVGQAAAGIDAAHRAGVVHGQVDSDSFRLAGSGVLKVVGFGMDDREPVRGDARYAAPERVAGGAAQAPGDVYALGAVCYELLCGRTPSAEPGGRPVPPSAIRPELPPELDRLVLAMLSDDPAKRPVSGENIRRTLAAIARPKPAPGGTPMAGGTPVAGGAPVTGANLRDAALGAGFGAANPGSGATEVFPVGAPGAPGRPPRAGDTAIYQATDLEPDQGTTPTRKLIIQLGVAVLVIAIVAVGMVLWAGARNEEPVAVVSTPPTTAAPTVAPTTEAPPPVTPSDTPSVEESLDEVVTVEPDPNGVVETISPKGNLREEVPPGGYDKWLQEFDEALSAQQSMNGISPRVAGQAREKLRRAARKAHDGHGKDSTLNQIAGVYRDLAKAQQRGEMDGHGPAADFIREWPIPGR